MARPRRQRSERPRRKIVARLDWEGDAGDLRKIVEDGLKKKPPRKPTPDQLRKLENEPEIDWGTMLLARAYAELSSCKPIGFGGRGPIPWTAMIEWCEFHNLNPEVTLHVTIVVRKVDSIFMLREAAEAKTTTKPNRRR